MRPHFRQVEGVQVIRACLFFRHDLHVQRPAGEILVFDALVQVAVRTFAVLAHQRLGFGIRQVFNSLLGFKGELDPETLVLRIQEAEGMAAEAVHVAEAARQAPVAHYHRHLVQRFRQRGPEVPVAVGAAQARARVALDGVVQIGEFQRVAHEEHGRVVADQVPVAFFRVELQGKAADIALRIRRAPLASDRGKAREHGCLLAHGAKDFRPRVARDVVRDGKRAMRAGTLGMHAALGDDFAVEVGQLFQEPHILQQGRATRAGRLDVLVVDDRRAKGGGQLFHWTLSL